MTRQARRHTQPVRALKALLLTASVVATMAGTRLLAMQDTAAVNASLPAIVESPTTTGSEAIVLPGRSRATELNLQAIPQVVQPRLNPVTRTRSSR